MVCGKIASGKSTMAAALAGQPRTVHLSEDDLLATLYPGEIVTLDDYVRCTRRLREAIAPHIVALLKCGLSVVLDFQTSTPAARAWSRSLFEAAGADHRLHYLEASDDLCKSRLAGRNAGGEHQYQVSDADYELFTSYFVPPMREEGFNLVVHKQD
jgi:predicted kinase